LARDQIIGLRKKYYRTSEDLVKIARCSKSDEDAKREIDLLKRFYSLQIGCET
jgi:DNA-binding transcriptional regulator GbsR (MarR family)